MRDAATGYADCEFGQTWGVARCVLWICALHNVQGAIAATISGFFLLFFLLYKFGF